MSKRFGPILLSLATILLPQTGMAAPRSADPANSSEKFASCLENIWPSAAAAGVSRATFMAATADVTADPSILARTGAQSEFSQQIWDYLAAAASPTRVANGQAKARAYETILSEVEARYGVDRQAIMGVWGLETNFGSQTGGTYIVRSLATLACSAHRGDFFRNELVMALRILEEGHIDRPGLRGSWAGAMGQTQFMPSSFMKYAVDYDGDGHKNIWTSVPDALASTANYLAGHGWLRGLPSSVEVVLPSGFAVSNQGRTIYHSFAEWRQLGVNRADGAVLPPNGDAALFLPAGILGPAFLITRNFLVIKAYNTSDSYALAVGYLGARIFGGGAIHAPWPRSDKPLSHTQRLEIQRRLDALGYDVGKLDGHFGEKTGEAIRAFQLKSGLTADGYATTTILERLKTVKN